MHINHKNGATSGKIFSHAGVIYCTTLFKPSYKGWWPGPFIIKTRNYDKSLEHPQLGYSWARSHWIPTQSQFFPVLSPNQPASVLVDISTILIPKKKTKNMVNTDGFSYDLITSDNKLTSGEL